MFRKPNELLLLRDVIPLAALAAGAKTRGLEFTMNQIIPPSFLFNFSLSIPRNDALPLKKGGPLQLSDSSSVFVPGSLATGESLYDLKAAWNESGIGFQFEVRGKKFPVAGTKKDLKSSDSIRLFLDLRHTANVHRATEFCSALVVLPVDEESSDRPSVMFTEIAQQRTARKDRDGRKCLVQTTPLDDGYRCEIWIPGTQLLGFDELASIGHFGFYCVVVDSELGELPLSIGGDFPTSFDPSTWLQLRLTNSD